MSIEQKYKSKMSEIQKDENEQKVKELFEKIDKA